MAKMKKTNALSLAFSAGSVLFAVVAFFMLFVNAVDVVVADKTLTSFTGVQVAFGYSKEIAKSSISILGFSMMNLLPYLLVIAGAVVAVFAARGKKSFLLNVIAVVCFAVAAVLFFTASSFVCVAESKDANFDLLTKSIMDALKDGKNIVTAVGSILGGVFSVIAAGCSAAKLFVK